MSRSILTAFAASVFAVASFAGEGLVFPPSPWGEMKIVRGEKGVQIKDAKGKSVIEVFTEGGLHHIKDVDIEIRDGGLFIDPTKAFADKSGKVQIVSCDYPPPEALDGLVDMESFWRGGENDARIDVYVIGTPKEEGGWSWARANVERVAAKREKRTLKCGLNMPKFKNARFRFDVVSGGPVLLEGGRILPFGTLMPDQPEEIDLGRPTLLFRASFDHGAEAELAKGDAKPVRAEGLEYAPGVKGKAVRLTAAANSALEYAFAGNARPEGGTVSMWVKRERPDGGFLFGSAPDLFSSRIGTGALFVWLRYATQMRGDFSDDGDRFMEMAAPAVGEWHHVALTWAGRQGAALYLDGTPCAQDRRSPMGDIYSPISFAKFGERGAFSRLTFGGGNTFEGRNQIEGLIDEVKVYSAPLDADAVKKLYLAERPGDPPKTDYPALAEKSHSYVGDSLAAAGQPGERELVTEIKFDRLPPTERFSAVGDCRIGELNGVKYVEAGTNANDRFAVALDLNLKEPFYWLEIDYPDDKKRTMDMLAQDAMKPDLDYTLGVGVMCGGEYASSGKIRTHRCILWTRAAKSAVAVMTARAGAPAAVSAIRLYRDRKRLLPEARMNEPPKSGGWGRTIGIYYEDVSVNEGFTIDVKTPADQVAVARRLAATMKFAGENLFAHPGAWYHGLIDEGYSPRGLFPDYLSAFYSVFDCEGLGVMPTLNWDSLPFRPGQVNAEMLKDGSVHRTVFSVDKTGRFREQRGLSEASLYNFAHPEVQRSIEAVVDRLIEQGKSHPSFKGISLHLKYNSVGWFGRLDNGYNDYCIDAFEKATGIHVPVDRADPLRGREYAKWLLANAREPWIRWRCSVVTGFWIRMAKKLAAARPDLRLWINHVSPYGSFLNDDMMMATALEGGFDPDAFSRGAPNGMLSVTHIPADYRWWWPGFGGFGQKEIAWTRDMKLSSGFWDFVRPSAHPMAHSHDRYWEDACGRNKSANLTCEWMKEQPWRVGTINPGGRDALEQFAGQLRHTDLLGITKGGYLISTYGMEDVLAPFAQAFRALPAKVMTDVPGAAKGDVRVRECSYNGKRYFYAVNTGAEPAEIALDLPKAATDLVSGERLDAGRRTLRLDAYELRSFAE